MHHLQQTVGAPLSEEEKQRFLMEFGYKDGTPNAEEVKEPVPMKHVVKVDTTASPQKMVRDKFAKARELHRRVSDGDHPNDGMDAEFNKTPTGSTMTGATGSASSTTPPQPDVQRQAPEIPEIRRALHFQLELITEEEMRRLQGGRSVAMGPPLKPPPEEPDPAQPEWLQIVKGMLDNEGDRMEGMFRGLDNRMSRIEEVLISSTARMQQRLRDLDASMRYEVGRNNERQDARFGEELRRV